MWGAAIGTGRVSLTISHNATMLAQLCFIVQRLLAAACLFPATVRLIRDA